jgi:predicted TIM-barrel fold metal-dependent hydrolase
MSPDPSPSLDYFMTFKADQPRSNRRQFAKAAVKSTFAGSWLLNARVGAAKSHNRDPVVDTHMHVWSSDPKRFPFNHPYAPDFKTPKDPGTVEMLLADMDRNGVTHSILVQVIFHGWDNTYVDHCVQNHPNRLKAHGLIDPTDPQVARKLECWMKEGRLSGMRFSPIYYQNGRHGGDGWLNSEVHHTLWAKAGELGAIFNIFIATTQLPKLERMIKQYPQVRIIVDHLSQADLKTQDPMPEFKKLLALARYPNVWVKVSELTSVSKSGQYPFPDALPWVQLVYEHFGPDRLLWGTGYPGTARAAYQRPTLSKELALIRREIPFFTAEDQKKILGLNAASLWGLKTT